MLRQSISATCICFLGFLTLLAVTRTAEAQYILLVPDQPTVESPLPAKKVPTQMDVLVAFVEPQEHAGIDLDRPQMFAVIRRSLAMPENENAREQAAVPMATREDLLGNLEEIKYLNRQAWAANVPLSIPGLYQLITESRPWWNAKDNNFIQQFVKTTVPVFGEGLGWDEPANLKFEILPLTRPFGNVAPTHFRGKVLLSGTPLPDCYVKITRHNTEERPFPSPWHESQLVKTDGQGIFSFVCPLPGWWGFMAVTQGDPLKGPDGQIKPLEMGAIIWMYVDENLPVSRRRK
ncbi:MAG: DUF4198 domain-containing protein [Desulfovibrionaceae bacterium]